jgi:hypothetical protein
MFSIIHPTAVWTRGRDNASRAINDGHHGRIPHDHRAGNCLPHFCFRWRSRRAGLGLSRGRCHDHGGDPDRHRYLPSAVPDRRFGDTTTHHLLVTNLTGADVGIETNGHLTATIVDPDTGVSVGGYAGAKRLPLVTFTAAPATTVRIPLLVGTASYRPALGYTVPPGTWWLTAPIRLADGRHLTTPPLAVTSTD